MRGAEAEVWDELVRCGTEAFREDVYGDALAVSQEIVRRTLQNLNSIEERLRSIGYEFASPSRTIVEASQEDRGLLTQVEERHGRLPLILRAWYERISSVDFTQCNTQLDNDERLAGLGKNTVLYFLSLREALEFRQSLIDEDDRLGPCDECDDDVEYGFFLPIGGFASNCEPKGVLLPAAGVDSVIYNDGGGDVLFVRQLRTAFQWLGFPFWRRLLGNPRNRPRRGEPDFGKILPQLKCDLLTV